MPEIPGGYDDDPRDPEAARTRRIAELNDALRRFALPWGVLGLQPPNGDVITVTQGVVALAEETKLKALCAIHDFDAFTEDCDPYGEHQMGIVQADAHKIMFWMDYYDRTLEYGSPDPADASVTKRVMTILFPEERAPGKLACSSEVEDLALPCRAGRG